MIIELNDLTDPRLDDFLRLTDVALRKKFEPERGVFLAEGDKVIARALQAGHEPRAAVLTRRWVDSIAGFFPADVPIFVLPEDLLTDLTGFSVHRGAIAAMQRPQLPDLEQFMKDLGAARRLFVLEDLVNHTNVGAIFRSAAALGVDAVLVSEHCSDPLYRRSIKVSMGTVFQIPWTRITGWPGSMQVLHEAGWKTAALALSEDAQPLDAFAEKASSIEKLAMVFGTEGDGLSKRTIANTDYVLKIPMAGGVDSLNVAATSAVVAWALRA